MCRHVRVPIRRDPKWPYTETPSLHRNVGVPPPPVPKSRALKHPALKGPAPKRNAVKRPIEKTFRVPKRTDLKFSIRGDHQFNRLEPPLHKCAVAKDRERSQKEGGGTASH